MHSVHVPSQSSDSSSFGIVHPHISHSNATSSMSSSSVFVNVSLVRPYTSINKSSKPLHTPPSIASINSFNKLSIGISFSDVISKCHYTTSSIGLYAYNVRFDCDLSYGLRSSPGQTRWLAKNDSLPSPHVPWQPLCYLATCS